MRIWRLNSRKGRHRRPSRVTVRLALLYAGLGFCAGIALTISGYGIAETIRRALG